MGARLGVARAGTRSAEALAAHSRSALDRPLRHEAELWVAVARDEALLAGAFQRGATLPDARATAGSRPVGIFRRGSGGPDVFVGEGTIHVVLSLTRPGALIACDAKHIVNRLVRPLLRALTKAGSQAHFFGRDWVSVTKGQTRAPAGWVGFGHDATTKRTVFEAFLAVRSPFALRPGTSLRGKTPRTLEAIAGGTLDAGRIAEGIAVAYEACANATEAIDSADACAADRGADIVDPSADPPWAATLEEAIGCLGAGPDGEGSFRIGGDLLVSRDALARLEARAAGARDDDLGAVVEETLGAPGVALEGIKSLGSVRDVIVNARRAGAPGHAPRSEPRSSGREGGERRPPR